MADSTPFRRLTVRERQIVLMLARGLSNAQISTELALNLQTVKNRLSEIYSKVGVRNRTELVVEAMRGGLLDEEFAGYSVRRSAAASASGTAVCRLPCVFAAAIPRVRVPGPGRKRAGNFRRCSVYVPVSDHGHRI